MIDKPLPPPTKYWCDACGTLESPDKHKNIFCKLFKWLDSVFF
jgi:hypothetical protein